MKQPIQWDGSVLRSLVGFNRALHLMVSGYRDTEVYGEQASLWRLLPKKGKFNRQFDFNNFKTN